MGRGSGARSALTMRGRCLVGGGLALGLTGAVLGEQPLVQLAAFVLALPVLAWFTVARGRFRMTTRRVVRPPRVPRGAPAEVVLQLGNSDTRRGGLWLLTEQVPAALGRPHRFSVAGLAAGAGTTVRYRLLGRHRGRYQLGPLRLRILDPFGLVERTAAGTDTASLAVVPRVRPLGRGGPGGEHGSGGDGVRRALAVHGDDDVSVREYRQGDDLRKVHWRATARTGELMVRLEERPWRAQGTLLLDTRARAHLVAPAGHTRQVPGPPGDDCPPPDSLEWLVEAAASIGVALVERGAELRVVTETGELPPAPGRAGLGAEELLDRLAVVGPSRVPDLSAAVPAACRAAGDGPLICLLGAVGPDDVADLVRLRPGPATGLAVLMDIAGWAAPVSGGRRGAAGAAPDALAGQREQAAAMLAGAGWRVATAAAGQDVAEVWAALGSLPAGAPA